MSAGPKAPELLSALAAAAVEADVGDSRSLREVAAALERARKAGALFGPLADEAAALTRALRAKRGAAEALQRVAALLGDDPAAAPPAPAARSARRDPETVELIGDFLGESGEGLVRADGLLLAIEKHGPTADEVHALFRVFHTIKGVAGFLELADIVSLSHATENLLNLVRDARLRLEGEVFEAVFDATAVLRTLLQRLRDAVDAGVELRPDPEVAPLVERIGRVAARAAAAPAAAPAPAPAAEPSPPAPSGVEPPADAPAAEPAVRAAGGPAPAMPEFVVRPAPAKPAAAAPSAPGEAAGAQLRETVKVDLERVDSIVEMIGELIIVEAMVVHAPELERVSSLALRDYLKQLTKISRELQGVAMRMRMVPVRAVFQKMARLARDLSRKVGKDVVLELAGEETEMDRSMVERIEDPLVHLVRNAIDHGVETPEERRGAGKPAQAVLHLSARHEGGSIVVELSDDGRGLHRDRILAKARERGLVPEGQDPGAAELSGLLFLPGFSTAAKVTELSGRGVGLDVVKRNVEGMRGRVSVTSTAGQGTTFRLVLPLTLAIIDGMLVLCGAEKYIIPSLSIVESLRPTEEMISRAAGRDEVIDVRGEILPLLRLHRLLEMPGPERPPTEGHVVVVESMGRKIGLVLDDVLTQQQVVIKPVGSGIGGTDYLSGAAILSDGRVGLILNVDRLAELTPRRGPRTPKAAGA